MKNESSLPQGSNKRLDDWYRLINGIYLDRNFFRTLDSVYLHFVEVSRTLQLAGEDRKRDIDPETYLPKSLAWWFAACGRAGIPSVERMVWGKFPGVCPYCQLERHDASQCKESDPAKKEINWTFLKQHGDRNRDKMPRTLAGWQQMFQQIYPKDDNTKHSSNSKRLSEEVGEAAEAVKVFSIAPTYFVSEAPDIFSWMMSFANKFDFDFQFPDKTRLRPRDYGKRLEDALEKNYPGACTYCGFTICKCPPILPEHLGRIAKEAPVDVVFSGGQGLFSPEQAVAYFSESQRILKIGHAEVKATNADLRALQEDLRQVRQALESQTIISGQLLVGFSNLVGQLEAVARQGNLVQSDIQQIVAFVNEQPQPARQALLSVLSGIAGNAWHSAIFAALIKAFGLGS